MPLFCIYLSSLEQLAAVRVSNRNHLDSSSGTCLFCLLIPEQTLMYTEDIIISVSTPLYLLSPSILNHGLDMHVCHCLLRSGYVGSIICQVLHGRGSYSRLPSEHSLIKDQSGLQNR